MKIIRSYWSDKIQEIKSESEIKELASKINKVYIGHRLIKNFKMSEYGGRFICYYSLGSGSQRYYFSLLNHALVINGDVLIALEDINYLRYPDELTEKTKQLLLN